MVDLIGRAAPSSRGRLLDLACGTGQLVFPLAPWFAEVWADMVGRYEFTAEHSWTVSDLAGLIRSTSFLPPSVLAEHGAEFGADLAAALGPYAVDGRLAETVQFAYELARRRG